MRKFSQKFTVSQLLDEEVEVVGEACLDRLKKEAKEKGLKVIGGGGFSYVDADTPASPGTLVAWVSVEENS